MSHLSITQVVSPHTFDYKEAIFHCKSLFGITDQESNRILKQLVNPAKMGSDKLYFYVARKGDDFAGFVIVYYLSASKLAFLEYIGVLPEMRRTGVGSVLYDYVLDLVKKDNPGVRGMFYEVSQDEVGIESRTKFFVSQGAISFDISKFDISTVKAGGRELKLMYHPFDQNWYITGKEVPQVMSNLTSLIV